MCQIKIWIKEFNMIVEFKKQRKEVIKIRARRIFFIVVLIVIMNIIYIGNAQNLNETYSKTNSYNAKELKNEYSLLSVEIDKKITDMEKLLKELESKQIGLDESSSLKKYIDFDMSSDLDRIEEIAAQTPLDIETSAIVVYYSKKFNIKPSLILAVIKLESNFNKYEVGKHKDRGYMQIIPSTEKWLAQKYEEKLGFKYNPERIFEAEYNIGLGVVYLSILKQAYGENYDRILSEYNRGPYNLKEYYEKHKTYATSYSRGVLNREKVFIELND